MVYTYNGILLSLRKEGNSVIYYNTAEPWWHYVKWNKPVTKGQILYDSTNMKCLKLSKASSEILWFHYNWLSLNSTKHFSLNHFEFISLSFVKVNLLLQFIFPVLQLKRFFNTYLLPIFAFLVIFIHSTNNQQVITKLDRVLGAENRP